MALVPPSPRLLKGGIVLVDPQTLAPVQNGPVPGGIIALQYNPDSITRTLQAATAGGEGQDRSEAMRLKGPPLETIKLEAEIDATDQLDKNNSITAQYGIQPQLAALESMIYPTSRQIEDSRRLAASGTLEILPVEAPLPLFIWSKSRIIPVRITEFGITEEAFDTELNPIRAKVSLGLRVLNMNDLGFDHRGSDLFSRYHREKEDLAKKSPRLRLRQPGDWRHRMTDPLQMLMQQAADAASPFGENSRYRNVETATGTLPDGRPVTYLRRRFVPQPEDLATLAEHVVKPGNRLDNLAYQYLGDPELYWLICDANRDLRPDDLTDDPPKTGACRVIRVGLPPGVPASGES